MEHSAGMELRSDAFSRAVKLGQAQAWRTDVTSDVAGVTGEAEQGNKRSKAGDLGEPGQENSLVETFSKIY